MKLVQAINEVANKFHLTYKQAKQAMVWAGKFQDIVIDGVWFGFYDGYCGDITYFEEVGRKAEAYRDQEEGLWGVWLN